MSTTALPKNADDLYLYPVLSGYTSLGDHYHLRVQTGTPNTLNTEVGTEGGSMAIGDVAYVIATKAVEEATDIKLNASDTASFSAGDAKNTLKKVTLTATLTTPTLDATNDGKAGGTFVVMDDPGIDTSAINAECYVQSIGGKDAAGEAPKTIRCKGVVKGQKIVLSDEESNLSITQSFMAYDRGFPRFEGRNFHLLAERDESRKGVVTEQFYFFNVYLPDVSVTENSGDADSEVSLEMGYAWKAVTPV